MDSRRAESFSDGVFAVAITVLVFNLLPIADKTASDLTARSLGHYWPAYLAYVVSFFTIGIMWTNHHGMLGQVTKVDRPLLLLNLLLLMGIVALPFPTALVAQHLAAASGRGAALATVIYGLNMIFISVAFGLTWLYVAAHAQALGGSSQLRVRALSSVRFTAGNVGYVAGTLIAAFIWPVAGLIIFGLLAVYYMFEHLPTPDSDSAEDA